MLTNNRVIDLLQGGGEPVGFDNKGARKNVLVTGIGKNMLLSHGMNLYIPDLWSQLRFFTGNMSPSGNLLWAVDDRKKHQDDLIDAAFIAYACRQSFPHLVPVNVAANTEGNGVKEFVRTKLVYDRETKMNKRVQVFDRPRIEKAA